MSPAPAPDEVRIIDCTEADHAPAILEILNEAIVNSTALYDYVPRAPQAMSAWFATKAVNGHPVIGAVDTAGRLMGFASYGTFRAFPAYKYTVEHSVYLHRDFRGRGLGKALLVAICCQPDHVGVANNGWDAHANLPKEIRQQCAAVDQPQAALILDLDSGTFAVREAASKRTSPLTSRRRRTERSLT